MAINPKIKQKAEDIRSKIFGSEVRESLASGIEAISEDVEATIGRQSYVEEQFQNVIDETTGKDVISAPELIAARNGKSNLKTRLDDEHAQVTAQLQQTEQELNAQLADTETKFDVENWELNSKHRKKQGIVVFISDDGTYHDWTILKPLFESENVPLCTAIISSATAPNLTNHQIRTLEDLGWEIMSHSVTHSNNPYVIDMNGEEAEAEYRDSKANLIGRGFNVQSYAVPFGKYNTRERLLAKKYYRAARVSDYGKDGLNHSPIETHELKTIWLDETYGRTDFAYFKQHIDKAIESNALLIISTHANQVQKTATQDVFRQVIQYAKTNAKVMTLRDALNEMGNIIEVGDFTKSSTGTRAPMGQHFVVGCNGEIESSNVTQSNKYDPSTPFNEFPSGVTYTTVKGSRGEATNAPEGKAGTLITYKLRPDEINYYYGFNYQEYHLFDSQKMYKRSLKSNGTFGSWELVSPVNFTNNFTSMTLFSSFPMGVSFSIMNSELAGISNAPNKKAGTLVTHKIVTTAYVYNFQLYYVLNSKDIYKRYFTGESTFSDWVLVSGDKTRYTYNSEVAVPAKSQLDITVSTITGLTIDDTVIVSPQYVMTSGIIFNSFFGGDNLIRIRLYNITDTAILVNKTWFIDVIK